MWLGSDPRAAAPELRSYGRPSAALGGEVERLPVGAGSAMGLAAGAARHRQRAAEDRTSRSTTAGRASSASATLAARLVHEDYRNGAGSTIRFGDGEFGPTAARAAGTVFEVTYRLGNGARGNLLGAVTQVGCYDAG